MYKRNMPLLRKIFFYIFLLIYLIVCPQIILRMLGFVNDPVTHRWVKTGIIYASSNPPDAQVFINDRLLSEKTPAIIRDLPPGSYQLRMELEGYTPWENTIPVLDKKATSIENILLIPRQWHIKTLNNQPLKRLIAVTGTNFLLALSDDVMQDISILRLNKDIDSSDELEPLLSEESIYRDGQALRFFTQASSPFFIIEMNIADKRKYLWIDSRDKPVHIEDISELFPQEPVKLWWEPNDEKTIYAYYPGAVNRINIKAKAIYPNIDEKSIPVIKKSSPTDMPTPPTSDQYFLINNNNTFLFRHGKDIFLRDARSVVAPRLIKFLKVENNSDVLFSERTGKLYYIDNKTDLLSSIQVLHHQPFIPKPIAKTLRLEKTDE